MAKMELLLKNFAERHRINVILHMQLLDMEIWNCCFFYLYTFFLVWISHQLNLEKTEILKMCLEFQFERHFTRNAVRRKRCVNYFCLVVTVCFNKWKYTCFISNCSFKCPEYLCEIWKKNMKTNDNGIEKT